MRTVTQPHSTRNEGGRYSKGTAWYAAIEEANIQAVESTTRLAQVVGDAVTAMPDAASRIRKAATLVQHQDVWPLSDGTYLVGSQSDADRAYLVTRHPWSCECQDATHRQHLCKHTLAVMLTVKMGAVYQPTYDLPVAA